MLVEAFTADARRLAIHLSTKFGWRISHTAALEALAVSRGYKDWATYRAVLETPPAPVPLPPASHAARLTSVHAATAPSRAPAHPASSLRALPATGLDASTLPSCAQDTRLGQMLGLIRAHDWVTAVSTAKPGSLFVVAGHSGAMREESLDYLAEDLATFGGHVASLIPPLYKRPPSLPDADALGDLLSPAMRGERDVILVQQELRAPQEYAHIRGALEAGLTVVILENTNAVDLVAVMLRKRGFSQDEITRHLKGVLLQTPLRQAPDGSRPACTAELYLSDT